MPKKPLAAIEEHFSKVTDPRVERTKEHKLIDIIAIAICAVICGAEGWVDIDIIQGQIINLDGKQLRGSKDSLLGKRAIYMVSAWAEENELVLGQRKVDEKSNEITAIPELLKLLALSGCIVTIDAMGTQTNIAKTIVEGEADYVLSVKENGARSAFT